MTKLLSEEKIDDIEHVTYCKTIRKGKTQHVYLTQFARAIEAAVQRPIADLMCQWKSGKIGGDELADKLFSLFASTPSSAVLEAQAKQEPVGKPHRWNDDGERCLDCGDKDWMADKYCSAAPVVQEKQEPVAEVVKGPFGATIDPVGKAILHVGQSLYAAPVVQEKQEPVAWPVMGYGQVAIGGGKQPNGMSALLYLKMGEAREINADTTDLFPVGSEVAPDKLMACVYFKDGAAMQQTIDVLREMQQEIGYAAPVIPPDMVIAPREPTEAMLDAAMNRYKHVSPEAKARYTQMHRENFRCDYKAMIAAAEGKSNAVAHREAACGRSGAAEC